MSKIIVPLERRFSPVAKDQDAADSSDYLELLGYGKPKGWPEINARHCTIIRGLRRNGTENLHKEWPGPEIHFWRSGTAAKLGVADGLVLRRRCAKADVGPRNLLPKFSTAFCLHKNWS